MSKIKIAVLGYGNLGRGVELATRNTKDIEMTAVFSRREPSSVKTCGAPVFKMDEILSHKGEFDVLILCGGSATDLPTQTPEFVKNFNVVDSFDTHAKIPEHFAAVDAEAKKSKKVGVIAVGWDPGLFSLNRLYSESVLENGESYTFWGKGVSQGHSDAIRRVKGVVDARQYTVPIESALNSVRNGENPKLSTREKHLRECYVVVEDSADKARIENEIKTMPNYFADYNTSVHFVDLETLKREHGGIQHGGFVLRSGKTGENDESKHLIEFSLKLDSNPEFTASVLVAYARAAYRLNAKGESGAYTVFDIAPALISPKSTEKLRKEIL
ncbi:diaminopimelate dehydrogenase [Campylobacter sp. RM13119]|uniref:diaminopimelate dehydrogenase n=1 Tax=Campylobacter californiensis TaxID=1032243 RepID=UPI0014762D44|nr:diaminopimelate dehydrogenase [Campylobacter sp. RM13119]MBE3605620.1 diaminopimelate dehydrogenase [Campylobacter sp. RM13119]